MKIGDYITQDDIVDYIAQDEGVKSYDVMKIDVGKARLEESMEQFCESKNAESIEVMYGIPLLSICRKLNIDWLNSDFSAGDIKTIMDLKGALARYYAPRERRLEFQNDTRKINEAFFKDVTKFCLEHLETFKESLENYALEES